MLGLIPIGAMRKVCAVLGNPTPLPILEFFPVAAVVAVTLVFFNDLGAIRVLLFWLVFVACFQIRMLPFPSAGYVSLAAETIVAIVYLIRAKIRT